MRGFSNNVIRYAVLTAGLLLAGNAAQAQINLSTGLDATNTLLASGGLNDAHWTVSGNPAQSVYPNNADWFSGWLANGPASTWIAINANVANNGAAPYTFTRTFDLTGFDISTASLTGAWAIDDAGTVNLNGNLLDTQGSGGWGSLHNISAPAADFVSGVNTLTITMTTDDQFLEAVRLEGSVTASPIAATPEPGSAALLSGLLITGAGLLVRRHKRRK